MKNCKSGCSLFSFILKLTVAVFVSSLTFSGCAAGYGAKVGKYSIEGKVSDRDGNPVKDVEISVEGLSSAATTGSDGKYSLSGIGKNTCVLNAKKDGFLLVPDFENSGKLSSGFSINVGQVSDGGTVRNVNFTCVKPESLSISDIQGSGAESPLKNKEVTGVVGVVTMVMNQAPHWNYDNTAFSGEDAPQFVGSDGFFIEALPDSRDFSGKKSNGIFVNTHDSSYSDSKWKDGIPTNLQAGDVVSVNGIVEETRMLDRYGSAEGTMTRTEINATAVIRVEEGGKAKTSPYPVGVLVTYNPTAAENWKTNSSYTIEGKTYPAEARVMVYDVNSPHPMLDAIDVLESMESMVIRIENPLVVGATYYNLTGVLADGGKDASGKYFRTFNETWGGDVIRQNPETGYQDYNEELLFVDYQPVDWSAYKSSIPQIGDTLIDSTGKKVFRGVLDYTCDATYMAHPLNRKSANYIQSTADNYITPFYTYSNYADGYELKDLRGEVVPDQKWDFSNDSQWINKLPGSAFIEVSKENVLTGMKSQASNTSSQSENGKNVYKWRTGTSSKDKFDASGAFTPSWTAESSTSKGNKNAKSLTVASFNFENYEAQGGSYSKDKDIALVIKNNLLYPDVLSVVEMGDDVETPQVYENQDNAYALKDGVVTAVRNFSGISDDIVQNGGPRYEFRCVDPKEHDSGGKPGVNIRVGLMYNTERVQFVDSGLVSNYYANTHGEDGKLLPESKWPVQTKNDAAQGWALSDANAVPYKGADGRVHLTQSPGYIQDAYFNRSRRPLAGEFRIKDADGNVTDENFIVVACHLSSKRGDYSLYGSIQPPLLLSEVKRNGQAKVIYDFVQKILALDKNARVVICGDMNDFAFGTPMKVMTGVLGKKQILFSLAEEFMPDIEQFSYAFEGNLQQLDHIYVSPYLFNKAKAEGESDWKKVCFIPHIDSLFTRNNHYNLSDHDPDIIRIPEAF